MKANKVRRAHDLAEGHILAALVDAAAQGAALHHAHDVFIIVAVHGYAAEMPGAALGAPGLPCAGGLRLPGQR